MKPRVCKSKVGAFTLVELLVVIAIIGILAALIMPTLSRAKKKTNEIVCLNNLKQLGIAMTMYQGDNSDKLPYAGIRMKLPTKVDSRHMTWDSLLNQYLGGKLTEEQLWNPVRYMNEWKDIPVLKCPSDLSPRPEVLPPPLPVHRRSYSMPRYMDARGKTDEPGSVPWPPSSDSQTGIGLNFSPISPFWNKEDNSIGDGSPANPRPSHQAAIKVNIIMAPSATNELTEHIHVNNVLGGERHDVVNAADQMASGAAPVYSPPYFYAPGRKIS
ncbi:MAG: prepilin-type N-terminal cleavage/methylation domain-containing protein [Verrucomicrobia bacterium]|nr:prepilin-type N-terminal cleavage/methylation domain-containing protein [Verrucomicrobiota bacterium]